MGLSKIFIHFLACLGFKKLNSITNLNQILLFCKQLLTHFFEYVHQEGEIIGFQTDHNHVPVLHNFCLFLCRIITFQLLVAKVMNFLVVRGPIIIHFNLFFPIAGYFLLFLQKGHKYCGLLFPNNNDDGQWMVLQQMSPFNHMGKFKIKSRL